MKKILKYVLIVLGTLALAALLYQFRMIVVMLLVSLLIAVTSRPALTRLEEWGLSGFLAQFVILVLAAGLLIGFFVLAGPSLSDELQRMTNLWFLQYKALYQSWIDGETWQRNLLSGFPEPSNITDYYLGAEGELIFPAAVNLTENLGAFFGTTFIILTFSLYWAQDEDNFVRILLTFFSARRRGYIRSTWRKVEHGVGMYARHELILGLLAASLLGLGYWLFQTPFPMVLTVLGLIGWLIPLVGIAVVLIPVILATTGSVWWVALISSAYTLLVFFGLRYWVKPKYLTSTRYSNFLIVFWVVVLGGLLGVGGYLAGPIVAVGVESVWKQYISYRSNRGYLSEGNDQIIGIRERLSSAYEQYDQINDQFPSRQLESIFNRLEESIQKVEQLEDYHFYESRRSSNPDEFNVSRPM